MRVLFPCDPALVVEIVVICLFAGIPIGLFILEVLP